MTESRSILYSFRRCPYAMRARMALASSGQTCELREVVLRDMPDDMLKASPKATVPVLVRGDGTALEESLEIMLWALNQYDPASWLNPETGSLDNMLELIAVFDESFKHHLDRYKYATRYEGADPLVHRAAAAHHLEDLKKRLEPSDYLFGNKMALADIAIAPFIRQFSNTDTSWFCSQPWPRVREWLSRVIESDAFTSVMDKYPQWKPGNAGVMFPASSSE